MGFTHLSMIYEDNLSEEKGMDGWEMSRVEVDCLSGGSEGKTGQCCLLYSLPS